MATTREGTIPMPTDAQQAALDVRAEEDAILAQYARAKALAAEAKQLEAEAKERALALCSALKRSTLSSDAGVLAVSDVAGVDDGVHAPRP